MIYETVVTTVDREGRAHVAPFGVRYRGREVVLMPFKPSATLDNIRASGHAVLNLTTDVRVFAGAVCARWLGPREWPLVPTSAVPGMRLANALAHSELELVHDDDHAERPTLRFARVRDETHAPFAGFNRAQAAVIEGAVLVSRLHMLPREKVDGEVEYLRIAIDKTAGDAEREAWGWLMAAVRQQREAAAAKGSS
ncbi:DUF447 domain-containing protein [Caldimonas sp. KR1-144]|uniref:DUF447 domain-containing protein n=1 Tax=Caldimonas sp. KR1-144 TaxID=3400911 RepID=UPI003C0B6FA2